MIEQTKILDLISRLKIRAEIRRNIPNRRSVQNNEPDRICNLLEEAALMIEELSDENDKLSSLLWKLDLTDCIHDYED